MRARLAEGASSFSALRRIMQLKSEMMSRALTNKGTPPSIAAMVTVSDFVRLSLLVVKRRAIVRAEGMRFNVSASALSDRFRRAAHSLTTRRKPRNPCVLIRRHSSVAFRLPAAHWASSHSSEHLADQAAAMTGTAHDFLYRGTVLCERHDDRVGLFASEIALVLKAFGGGQQLGIDARCTERLTDLPHRFADGA